MGAVLINTYYNCKLAYLYTVATLLFVSPIFFIVSRVLVKWNFFCEHYPLENPRCPTSPKNADQNILLVGELFYTLSFCTYHIGHFLFAYRYFEVAEMFGREDKTPEKHITVRKVTQKISFVGVAIIVINYLFVGYVWVDWRIKGRINKKLNFVVADEIPLAFLTIDCVLLFISLVWIFHSLRYDKQARGNERWMGIHTVLLTITLVS
jgi:hypothetical protein